MLLPHIIQSVAICLAEIKENVSTVGSDSVKNDPICTVTLFFILALCRALCLFGLHFLYFLWKLLSSVGAQTKVLLKLLHNEPFFWTLRLFY